MVVVRQRNQVAGLVRLISRISNLQANLHEYLSSAQFGRPFCSTIVFRSVAANHVDSLVSP